MQEDERLPDNNPVQVCPKCKLEYPVWRLCRYSGEMHTRLAHNFCPANTPEGQIVSLCMKCKMDEIKARWAKERQ